MLIDEFLPAYSVAERHGIDVDAGPEVVYGAIRRANLAEALPVRLLLGLRALPAALLNGRVSLASASARPRGPVTLERFERYGFVVLAENPPQELVIGLAGAFWTLTGDLCTTDASRFRAPQAAGTARAAWNFVVEARGPGKVRLSTETRVAPADAGSARRFRAYWFFIRPWSALIRRLMLRAIRDEAERHAVGG